MNIDKSQILELLRSPAIRTKPTEPNASCQMTSTPTVTPACSTASVSTSTTSWASSEAAASVASSVDERPVPGRGIPDQRGDRQQLFRPLPRILCRDLCHEGSESAPFAQVDG